MAMKKTWKKNKMFTKLNIYEWYTQNNIIYKILYEFSYNLIFQKHVKN